MHCSGVGQAEGDPPLVDVACCCVVDDVEPRVVEVEVVEPRVVDVEPLVVEEVEEEEVVGGGAEPLVMLTSTHVVC
jgi:hypothetical protein